MSRDQSSHPLSREISGFGTLGTVTVRELIREIKRPGRVALPVMLPSGCSINSGIWRANVVRIEVVKADVLGWLTSYAPDDIAPWYIVRRENGLLELDVNN